MRILNHKNIAIFTLFAATILGAGSTQKQADRPNVLFISIDDLNDWTGTLKGHPQAITPNLDELCNQGILFTNAHCSQAVCAASRNSLLSGIHPTSSGWYGSTSAMRKTYEQVMQDHKMLPQYFKDNGYKTLAVGKIFHQGVTDYKDKIEDFWDEVAPEYDVPKDLKDRGDGYGGTKFYPFPKNGSQIVNHYGKDFNSGHSLCWGALDREDMPGGKMFDELISEWAVDKLSENHDKPFFLAVGFVRPHVPYTAPKKYFNLFNPDEIIIPDVPDGEMADVPMMGKSIAFGTIKIGDHYAVTNLSDSYWREMVMAYLACISFVDDQVGKVIEALEKSSYADNTIVVLWSDHGQHLGEKKHWRKQALWEESTKVPLYFKIPGHQTKGVQSNRVVSLLDIYPTLVDLCDLPKAEKLDGHSLVPLLHSPDMEWEKAVLSTWYYKNHAVRSENFRYIHYRDGSEELYDHRNDPGEHFNLAEDPQYAEIIAKHKKWLPKTNALPAGTAEWRGDKLDRRIKDWTANDSIPNWLK
jgi:iduronate 2-sulfatase